VPAAAPSVDELKRAYLACNRAASRERLASVQVAHCSLVYEELKQRTFGGDFERLLAWSNSRR
jgi:hypothetical protein